MNPIHTQSIQEAIETPGRPYTRHVYSRDLKWVPQGDQAQRFPKGIRPIHEDILLAKLRPGQCIELEAHARRGVGKDHAKYSPVATASYRLMPHIEIVSPVYDELAEQLVHLYEPGVFQLVPCDDEPNHRVKAVLHNPYACTMSRNFMRDPVLKESIRMSRIPDHFIFSIESVGMLPPGVILADALRVLQTKCRNTLRFIDESLEAEGLNE
jgi:DNA-directed RNA polymerase I and III subunit RPAC1